ncbi:Uncharacterised protein [Candidatus Gugararchaeum adminiculabundum]|nr:Uncharacterised protein [Candidatus Gugararchaeum adminiculabundum]
MAPPMQPMSKVSPRFTSDTPTIVWPQIAAVVSGKGKVSPDKLNEFCARLHTMLNQYGGVDFFTSKVLGYVESGQCVDKEYALDVVNRVIDISFRQLTALASSRNNVAPERYSEALFTIGKEALLQHLKPVLIKNDTSAPSTIQNWIKKKTGIVRADGKLFDNLFNACLEHRPDLDLCAEYALYYAKTVKTIAQSESEIKDAMDAAGPKFLFPSNEIVMGRMSSHECAYLISQLDPGAATNTPAEKAERQFLAPVFRMFLEKIKSKIEATKHENTRLLKMRRAILEDLAKNIVERTEGRYFSKTDEATIAAFSKRIEYKQNPLYDEIVDYLSDLGLGYRPLCQDHSIYLNLKEFVLPLDGNEITVSIPYLKGRTDLIFTLLISAPPLAKGPTHGSFRTLAGDATGQFWTTTPEIGSDGKKIVPDQKIGISEPTVFTVKVDVLDQNRRIVKSNITETIIVLPRGETELRIPDSKFIPILLEFVAAGKITAEYAAKAIDEYGDRIGKNSSEFHSIAGALVMGDPDNTYYSLVGPSIWANMKTENIRLPNLASDSGSPATETIRR